MNVPRLLYRGAQDDTADTLRVETEEDLTIARLAGWRLTRRMPPVETPATTAARVETAQPQKWFKKAQK